MTKRVKIDDPKSDRLKYRAAPYSEPMLDTGVALLLYVGKLNRKWGCRTPLGDRVIGSTDLMTYEEARIEIRRIWDEERASGVKICKQEAEVPATFGDVWDQYLRWAKASGKTPAAIAVIRAYGATIEGLRNMPVATTKVAVLNKWRDGMVGTEARGGKIRTLNSVAKAVSSLLTALRRAGVDGEWQKMKAGVSVKRKDNSEAVPLLGNARLAFLAYLTEKNQNMGTYAKILAMTGARPGEITGARVDDVKGDKMRIRGGKTGARSVQLTPCAGAFLSALIRGREPYEPLVNGGPWTAQRCKRAVKRAAAAAETPHATLYGLRHGFITDALYASVPLKSVAMNCGTSVAMIELTYAHLVEEREAEVWAAMTQPQLRLEEGDAA